MSENNKASLPSDDPDHFEGEVEVKRAHLRKRKAELAPKIMKRPTDVPWRAFFCDGVTIFFRIWPIWISLLFMAGCLFGALLYFEWNYQAVNPTPAPIKVTASVSVKLTGSIPVKSNHSAKEKDLPNVEITGSGPVQLAGSAAPVPTKTPPKNLKDEFWRCLEITGMSIATIGFGDTTPKTAVGKFICIALGFVGIMGFGVSAGIFTTLIYKWVPT